MKGYIYITTNLINGKIYIGQHKVENNEFDTNYYGSGKLLLEAIDKYGKDNFKCELIDWCNSEEELNNKEIYYIERYKSTTENNNYNISLGGFVPRLSGTANGNFGKHRPHTEEEKRHLSEVTKGHKPTFTGPHSEAYKRYKSIQTSKYNLERDVEIYKKVSETAKGNKMMNKEGTCIRVHPEYFEKYIADGWVFGGLKRKPKIKTEKTQLANKLLGERLKNTIWIHKGNEKHQINRCELNNWLEKGFLLGMKDK